jgi:pimeloyl-ACP methyl ester carboxylesterase
LTHTYKGASNGFIPTLQIYDKEHDTNGFIGYRGNDESIYVVFRGSESIPNWLSNLDAILTAYSHCAGCEVHKGFYKAASNVFAVVQKEVARLKQQFSNFKVVVVGHSLGAALATLVLAELKTTYGVNNIRLVNFGSPRVGNDEFASWFSALIQDRMRVTHHKDTVPHVPMHERFTHISGEWYHEDDMGQDIRSCAGYEDDTCAYQWHATSIDDHMMYIGLPVHCSSV